MSREKKIEDAFRIASFHMYYHKICADIDDPTVRFAQAIVYSSRPVSFAEMLRWHKARKQLQLVNHRHQGV